jgi:hypothetical protein
MNKYEDAINKIVESYDAFYIENKYDPKNGTHKEEFALLEDLVPKGDKVGSALAWIKGQYDCYYKDSIDTKEGPFEYLRGIAKNM